MFIMELIDSEIERLSKRKSGQYNDGRLDGCVRSKSFFPVESFPDEDYFIRVRGLFRDYFGNGMENDLDQRPDLYRSGFRKSMRNVYHCTGFMVYDPMRSYAPVSDKQRVLIGILSTRHGSEFHGITKEEADHWITITENGVKK